MAASKKAKRKPVSTAPILREINKAMGEVRAKLKVASLRQQHDLDLEMKLLQECKRKIENIWLC